MNWVAAGRQILGARRRQEDRWEIKPWCGGLLALVADGMGGHRGGAIASGLAVEAYLDELARHDRPEPASGEHIAQALQRGLDAATSKVLERVRLDPTLSEMGCTLVAVALAQNRLHWISVGDSPLWIVENGHLRRLNADHSMRSILAEMVQVGKLSRENALRHPSRNALRSVLSRDPPLLVDRGHLLLKPDHGTRIMLASDGIETLGDAEVMALLAAASTAEEAIRALLTEVDRVASMGQDNATVVVAMPQLD